MLAFEYYRLTGYILEKKSVSLERGGSIARLKHCPMINSPLHAMNQCYVRTPILHGGEIQFVHPIKRQFYHDALTQNCSDKIKKLLQLDIDQEDSWYTLTPDIVQQDKPPVFGPYKKSHR